MLMGRSSDADRPPCSFVSFDFGLRSDAAPDQAGSELVREFDTDEAQAFSAAA
jgi:hypothetical protein